MGGAVVLWMHGLPLVPVFSGYYLLAGLAVSGRDAGGEWDMGVFDNIGVQLPSRLPGSLEVLHIQSLCMRDFVHLLNALQDLLQHRMSHSPSCERFELKFRTSKISRFGGRKGICRSMAGTGNI
ncbi:hypothetical protein N7527_010366 [Penicillium freii]|nr:hypothetical protein N7527_010366 [Penicillium freii]